MMLTSGRPHHVGRTVFVSLALLASVIAASVPLLHALAHVQGHGHGEAHAHGYEHPHGDHHSHSCPGDEHDEIHPDSLHDQRLVVPRADLDLAVVPLPEPHREPVTLTVETAPFVPESALHSRAPPRTAPARAPPLV